MEETVKKQEVVKENVDKLARIVSLLLEGFRMQMALCTRTEISSREIPNITKGKNRRIKFTDLIPNSPRLCIIQFKDKEFSKEEFISLMEKTQSDCMRLIYPDTPINRSILQTPSRNKDIKVRPLQQLKKLHISDIFSTSN